MAAETPGAGEHPLCDTRLLRTSRTGGWDGTAHFRRIFPKFSSLEVTPPPTVAPPSPGMTSF